MVRTQAQHKTEELDMTMSAQDGSRYARTSICDKSMFEVSQDLCPLLLFCQIIKSAPRLGLSTLRVVRPVKIDYPRLFFSPHKERMLVSVLFQGGGHFGSNASNS
jgi:hypothetical protein